MGRVAVLGSITMDLVFRVPRLPVAGETLFAESFELLDGGKGLNQAIAAARLGAAAALIGRVGADGYGERLVGRAAGEGVDVSAVKRDAEAATAVAVPLVVSSGDNVIVASAGANGRVSAADIREARAVIAGADVLLLQFETPLEAVIEAALIAHAAGRTVILNPAPARLIPPTLAGCVDILVVNEVEAAALAGAGEPGEQALRLAVGRRAAIVTLGPAGGAWAESGTARPFSAHHVAAVDAVGAGDAFCGALGAALADRRPLAEAVAFANAAAAISVTRHGAAPSLPTRFEVESLLDEAGQQGASGAR